MSARSFSATAVRAPATPENTLPAFVGAMDAGADGIELDVHLCASGELVVFHDDTLERLCGDRRRIADLAWSEVSELRVGGESIPTLSQVLVALPTALVNVEIKRPALSRIPATADALCAAVAPYRERVLVSSFDPRVLALVRLRAPTLARALLCGARQSLPLRRAWLYPLVRAEALHPEHSLIDSSVVAHWHRRGLRVHAWTVDRVERAVELADMGVDALITNHPGALRAALRS